MCECGCILFCRSGHGEQHQSHSEKTNRKSRREDGARYSHSRSPIPIRVSTRDRPLRGESLKRGSSSGRNSPMYIDERSRDAFREEHYSRDMESEDGRFHERLSGSSRFLAVREDTHHGERRGSRENKETYDRSGHREFKHSVRSSVRGHGERGGSFSLLRDDRRGSLKVSRRPHEHIERSRSSRPDLSSHYSRDSSRDIDRNVQGERHHKVREVRKERHHRVHHRHRNRREAVKEEASAAAPVVETVNISSDSAEEGGSGEVRSIDDGGEKIEDLIRDLESGSSSGEISDEESEKESATTTEREKERERHHSDSEKDKSSDGMFPSWACSKCSTFCHLICIGCVESYL